MYEDNIKNIKKAQNGDNDAMEVLIKQNSGLVWSIVKKFKDRGHDFEDLYQIGCIGLIKCIKKFNTTLDFKLSTYAVPYILGEIKRYIRDDGTIKVSRSIKELLTKINEIQRFSIEKRGKELTVKEIAKELNIDTEEVVYALTAIKPIDSINEEVYDGNSKTTLVDMIKSNLDEETAVVNKMTIEMLLNSLSNEERKIIVLRYYKEQTQSQVAKVLGINQVQVSRMEKRILNNLKKILAS